MNWPKPRNLIFNTKRVKITKVHRIRIMNSISSKEDFWWVIVSLELLKVLEKCLKCKRSCKTRAKSISILKSVYSIQWMIVYQSRIKSMNKLRLNPHSNKWCIKLEKGSRRGWWLRIWALKSVIDKNVSVRKKFYYNLILIKYYSINFLIKFSPHQKPNIFLHCTTSICK